ncbi:MAG: 30S ribosomal protein S4 [Spirochaetes bacterium]|nr:30S ribosomal protein S4 [Spirochaetota bacterium]
MGRYTGPRCKLCRREMTPLMLKGQRCLTDKCPLKGKKKYPPGPPRKRRAKLSDYAVQLREKQKIRRSYGLLEKQFRLLFHDALQKKGVTGDNLMSLLERRLDNVVFRMGFASSRSQARQLVRHKHVLVDGKTVDIPSFRVKENNVISVREKYAMNAMIDDSIKLAKATDSIPGWIEVDFEKRSGKIVRLPVREDLTSNFNDQLVIELYSK